MKDFNTEKELPTSKQLSEAAVFVSCLGILLGIAILIMIKMAEGVLF